MRAGEYGIDLTIATQFELTGIDDLKLWVAGPGATAATEVDLNSLLPLTGTSFVWTTPGPAGALFDTPGMYRFTLRAQAGASKQLLSGIGELPVEPALPDPTP